MLKLLYLVPLFLLFTNPATVTQQTHDSHNHEEVIVCSFDKIESELLNSHPAYKKEKEAYERAFLEHRKNKKTEGNRSRSTVYTFPVVVHIVHSGEPLGSVANPADSSIIDMIEEASQRFRHMHAGAGTFTNPLYGPDTEIEFCMATHDPEGNYTTGVVRHYAPLLAYGTPDYAALNAFGWDKSRYVNLFIMTHMGAILGIYVGSFYDFTLYRSTTFRSGLITHELGHYFSLAHTFQPNLNCVNNDCQTDGDGICDTPPKIEAGGICVGTQNTCITDEADTTTNNPYRSIALGGMGDQPDMQTNYMDYTEPCWDAFTEGQKDKMRFNIMTNRQSIVDYTDTACALQPLLADDAGIDMISIDQANECTKVFSVEATLHNYGSQTLSTAMVHVEVNDSLIHSYSWSGNLAPGDTQNISVSHATLLLADGENIVRTFVSDPNGNADMHAYNNSGYQNARYLGGDYCFQSSACKNLDENTSLGPGNPTTIKLSGPFPSLISGVNEVTICVKVSGDIDFPTEVFSVKGEDNATYGRTINVSQCSGFTPEYCFTIDSTKYNSWRTDDTISIQFDPDSTSINPNLCFTNLACARVSVPQFNSDSLIEGCTDIFAHNYNSAATLYDNCETCFDGIKNGDEVHTDCGGLRCPPCCEWNVRPMPVTSIKYSVEVTSDSVLYAAGQFDHILKSEDGGNSWNVLFESDSLSSWLDLHFINPTTGWAVGDSGRILKTEDGGATWINQNSGVGFRLRAVHFIDDLNGWAGGEGTVILNTEDGGSTWNAQSPGTVATVEDIQFPNADVGYILRRSGSLLKTTDGGDSWLALSVGANSIFRDLDFANADVGWCLGYNQNVIRQTTDGGVTWQTQDSSIGQSYSAIKMVDATEGYFCGVGGLIKHTTDGGSTWTEEVFDFTQFYAIDISYDKIAIVGIGLGGSAILFSKEICRDCPNTVTTTADSGPGSLRDIIECQSATGMVFLDADSLLSEINLTSSIVITKSLTIVGINGINAAVKVQGDLPVFIIPNGVVVQMENFSIEGSNLSGIGRAIQNSGNLLLNDMTITESNSGIGTLVKNEGAIQILGNTNIADAQ